MSERCLLCDKDAIIKGVPGKGEFSVECATCGKFIVDGLFEGSIKAMSKEKRAMISAYTRELFENGQASPFLSDSDELSGIIKKYEKKTLAEKTDSLIVHVRKKSRYFGEYIQWDESKYYPITYSPNSQEFVEIINHAKTRGYLSEQSPRLGLKLSGDGWERTEKLIKSSQ